jgi:hypothetical protein
MAPSRPEARVDPDVTIGLIPRRWYSTVSGETHAHFPLFYLRT